MSKQALEIDSLHYKYKSNWLGKPNHALKGISFQVDLKESFALFGSKGSGKTTLIKCLLNLIHPSSGNIKIFDVDHRKPAARSEIGFLPENPYLYDNLTVHELLCMYGCFTGIRRSQLDKKVTEVTLALEIQDKHNTPLHKLASQVIQKVAFAQAIIANPKLLILDQPFNGVDFNSRKLIKDLLVNLKQNGTSIFIATDDYSDIKFFCDRVALISQGNICGITDIDELSELVEGSYEIVDEHYYNLKTDNLDDVLKNFKAA